MMQNQFIARTWELLAFIDFFLPLTQIQYLSLSPSLSLSPHSNPHTQTSMLCNLTTFKVQGAPTSWLKHFFNLNTFFIWWHLVAFIDHHTRCEAPA